MFPQLQQTSFLDVNQTVVQYNWKPFILPYDTLTKSYWSQCLYLLVLIKGNHYLVLIWRCLGCNFLCETKTRNKYVFWDHNLQQYMNYSVNCIYCSNSSGQSHLMTWENTVLPSNQVFLQSSEVSFSPLPSPSTITDQMGKFRLAQTIGHVAFTVAYTEDFSE